MERAVTYIFLLILLLLILTNYKGAIAFGTYFTNVINDLIEYLQGR